MSFTAATKSAEKAWKSSCDGWRSRSTMRFESACFTASFTSRWITVPLVGSLRISSRAALTMGGRASSRQRRGSGVSCASVSISSSSEGVNLLYRFYAAILFAARRACYDEGVDTFLLALVVAVALLAGAVLWLLKDRGKPKEEGGQGLMMLQNQLNEMARTLDTKLGESTRLMQSQFGESAKIIREITKELVQVGEGQKQVMGVTDQLKNLQDILKNPKQRGVLGEYYLETVLKNVLPPGAYQMQYGFKDGSIVDAVVVTKEGIIPVDSKFSLENYNRILEAPTQTERERFETAFVNDLKNRVDETAKYIKPEEGTLGFAFMFIPSEAVYYDLLINKIGAVKVNTVNLIEYAAGQKKVMVVSPTTFLAYLQTVLQGLKALQIEETAKKIGERVQALGRHIGSYEAYMKKLGSHLGTALNTYNIAYKELAKIDKDVLRITGSSNNMEPMQLDRPQTDEEE